MADYTPVFLPGEAISLTASGTIAGGDPVEVSGNGTVAKAAGANSAKVVGMAGNDAAANARVTVYSRGTVHEGLADGGITAGDQVVASATANRQVATLAAADVGATPTQATINAGINQARAVIGVALTTATTGNKVRWMSF